MLEKYNMVLCQKNVTYFLFKGTFFEFFLSHFRELS